MKFTFENMLEENGESLNRSSIAEKTIGTVQSKEDELAQSNKNESEIKNSIFQFTHPVPHDLVELEHIQNLLEKIPLYQERLRQLELEVREFSILASKECLTSDPYEIEKMIFRAFFIDLEKRPFQSPTHDQICRLKANLVHEGIIQQRNISCEICGENRSVDRCHIMPRRLGGPETSDNILILCPTHHRLLDRYMLSRAEIAAINWEIKSEAAQEFMETVVVHSHKKFWQKVEKSEYQSLLGYEAVNEVQFVHYVIKKILSHFSDSRPIKRSRIYSLLDPSIHKISKKVISGLVKYNVLEQDKLGTLNILMYKPRSENVADDIILKIWQEIG